MQEKLSVLALYGSVEPNKDFLKRKISANVFMKKRRFWVFQTSPINLKALSTQKQGKHNFQLLKGILMHNLKSVSWKFNIL